ncbi:MAG: hypothetical protein RR834_05880 [Thermomonas sp.]|jgi:uncharacterized protein YkwD
MRKTAIALILAWCVGPVLAADPRQEPVACAQRQAASPREIAVLAEVNRARTSPRQYADTIRAVFGAMDAVGTYARGPRRVATVEGHAAVDEALRFLSVAEPVQPLQAASCLDLAAARHAKAKGSTGSGGHFGATGRNPSERASFLTADPVACSENIAYGYEDVVEMVAALIVDDGVPGRGHRGNIFDPRMRSFGSGRAPHLLRKTIDVQLFCLDDVRD